MPHRHWLAENFRQVSDVYRALLFRELQQSFARHQPHGITAYFKVDVLRAEQVVKHASPFFWLSVFRAFGVFANGDEQSRSLASIRMITAVLDSFSQAWGDGLVCEFTSSQAIELVMPKAGLRLNLTGKIQFWKSSDRLLIRSNGAEVAPQEFPKYLLGHDLPGAVLGVAGECIYEAEYLSNLKTNASVDHLRPIAKQIEDALNLLRVGAPQFWDFFSEDFRYYVEVSTDDIDVHRSFTSPQLPSVTFISCGKDRVRILEAIVHEFSHDTLNRYLDCAELFEGPDEAVYFSPWREDPRPLIGLMHALYVFGQVASVYLELDRNCLGPEEEDFVRRRLGKIYHSLCLGIAQVPDAKLTSAGRELIGRIEDFTDQLGRSTGEAGRTPPIELAEHHHRWHVHTNVRSAL